MLTLGCVLFLILVLVLMALVPALVSLVLRSLLWSSGDVTVNLALVVEAAPVAVVAVEVA